MKETDRSLISAISCCFAHLCSLPSGLPSRRSIGSDMVGSWSVTVAGGRRSGVEFDAASLRAVGYSFGSDVSSIDPTTSPADAGAQTRVGRSSLAIRPERDAKHDDGDAREHSPPDAGGHVGNRRFRS